MSTVLFSKQWLLRYMLHCTTTHQTHYHMLRDMIYPLRRLLMTLFFLICLCACLGCGSYGYRRYRRTSLPASYIVARGPGESHSHVPFHCQAIMVLLSPSSSPSPLLHFLCFFRVRVSSYRLPWFQAINCTHHYLPTISATCCCHGNRLP